MCELVHRCLTHNLQATQRELELKVERLQTLCDAKSSRVQDLVVQVQVCISFSSLYPPFSSFTNPIIQSFMFLFGSRIEMMILQGCVGCSERPFMYKTCQMQWQGTTMKLSIGCLKWLPEVPTMGNQNPFPIFGYDVRTW